MATEWNPGGMACWSKVASETNGTAYERHRGCRVTCQTDRDGQLVLELRMWQVGWAESPRDGIEQWIQALEARI